MWHMRDGSNVMEYIKPGEQMRMMHLSVNDTGILGKEIRVLLSGVEPKTFRLLVRMLSTTELQETRGS